MSTWIVAIVIACIPTFAWLYFLFRDTEKRRGMIAGIFFLGILTVIPLLIIQYSWNFFPALNVQQEIPEHINNLYIAKTLTFIIFAMLEEVFKQWLLRFADKKWLIVRSINDSIRFSMIAAMGFSFAENVYPYFFALIQAHQYQSLIGAYFFRSLFTSAAHLFFSGIFGYYYGMAKFIPNYRDQSEL
jgi:RsiW-degrading membrane proteinase PrsW (M82 family)